jgi:hypothetical protein
MADWHVAAGIGVPLAWDSSPWNSLAWNSSAGDWLWCHCCGICRAGDFDFRDAWRIWVTSLWAGTGDQYDIIHKARFLRIYNVNVKLNAFSLEGDV